MKWWEILLGVGIVGGVGYAVGSSSRAAAAPAPSPAPGPAPGPTTPIDVQRLPGLTPTPPTPPPLTQPPGYLQNITQDRPLPPDFVTNDRVRFILAQQLQQAGFGPITFDARNTTVVAGLEEAVSRYLSQNPLEGAGIGGTPEKYQRLVFAVDDYFRTYRGLPPSAGLWPMFRRGR